jgi:Leucine Rich repeats (2 copies)
MNGICCISSRSHDSYYRLEDVDSNSFKITELFQKIIKYLRNIFKKDAPVAANFLKDVPVDIFQEISSFLVGRSKGAFYQVMLDTNLLSRSKITEIQSISQSLKEKGEIHFARVLLEKIPNLKEMIEPILSGGSLSLSEKVNLLNERMKKHLGENQEDRRVILDLSNTGITVIPEYFQELASKLIKLDLSGNEIAEIPKLSLPKLKQLYLSNGYIDNFSNLNLPELRLLDISQSFIDKLPECVSSKLTHINIEGNNSINILELKRVLEDNDGNISADIEGIDDID